MAGQTDFAALAGAFIDAWSDDVVEAYKTVVPILADAKFTQREMVGGVYHQPVRLTFEGGQTFTAAQATPGDSGYPYVGARSGYVPDAEVEGMQINARSRITYEAIFRSGELAEAMGAGNNRRMAVRGATKLALDGLMLATLRKLEALMLYGRAGLALVGGSGNISNVVGGTANPFDGGTSGYAIDIRVSAETWAPALWAGLEGHTFDIFSDSSGLPSTKQNTTSNSVLTSGTGQTGFVLLEVEPSVLLTGISGSSDRVLRFWHSSGTAGAPGTGVIGGWTTHATNNFHVCFESSSPTQDFVGIDRMAAYTGSGTLFGISGTNYGMWRGNSFTNVGNLKLGDLVRYLSKSIDHGAQGKLIRAVVPTELFAQFANDEAALRRYSAMTSEAENGFDSLKMYLPHKGVLEVLGHSLCKAGYAYAYVPDELIRVGSRDVSLVGNGRNKEQFVLEVAQSPAREVRVYGQFAPICATPRHMTRLTGITY